MKRIRSLPLSFLRFIGRWCIVVLVGILPACISSPPPRLEHYLGPVPQDIKGGVPDTPIEAGLLVINDTSAPRSTPPLSEQALAFLRDHVIRRVEGGLPIKIVKILPNDMVAPGDRQALLRAARDQGLPYLLAAVFSSQESEVPVYLPLDGSPEQGGSRPKVSGFETNNYALAELALLDVRSGQVVAKAEGTAWSKLNHLYAPLKSNAYPVIHRSGRIAPIYPSEENAKDVLRSIAADEALEQTVLDLQRQKKAQMNPF